MVNPSYGGTVYYLDIGHFFALTRNDGRLTIPGGKQNLTNKEPLTQTRERECREELGSLFEYFETKSEITFEYKDATTYIQFRKLDWGRDHIRFYKIVRSKISLSEHAFAFWAPFTIKNCSFMGPELNLPFVKELIRKSGPRPMMLNGAKDGCVCTRSKMCSACKGYFPELPLQLEGEKMKRAVTSKGMIGIWNQYTTPAQCTADGAAIALAQMVRMNVSAVFPLTCIRHLYSQPRTMRDSSELNKDPSLELPDWGLGMVKMNCTIPQDIELVSTSSYHYEGDITLDVMETLGVSISRVREFILGKRYEDAIHLIKQYRVKSPQQMILMRNAATIPSVWEKLVDAFPEDCSIVNKGRIDEHIEFSCHAPVVSNDIVHTRIIDSYTTPSNCGVMPAFKEWDVSAGEIMIQDVLRRNGWWDVKAAVDIINTFTGSDREVMIAIYCSLAHKCPKNQVLTKILEMLPDDVYVISHGCQSWVFPIVTPSEWKLPFARGYQHMILRATPLVPVVPAVLKPMFKIPKAKQLQVAK
jgi:hypothetical protein